MVGAQTVSKSILRIALSSVEGGLGRLVGVEVLPDIWFLADRLQACQLHGCIPSDASKVLVPQTEEWLGFQDLALVFVNAHILAHQELCRQGQVPDFFNGDYLPIVSF